MKKTAHKNSNKLARVIWNYTQIPSNERVADCIIVMGSYDTSVAKRGASLFIEGVAPLSVTTGGRGRLTPKTWEASEAEKFADIMVEFGVPKEKILIEKKSTNTSENIYYTKELLEKNGISIKSAIFVMHPCLERRAYAMFRKKWPELEISPPPQKIDYIDNKSPGEEVINLLVGEVSRYIVYGEKGYMEKQKIPKNVINAFKSLSKQGFNKYLVNKLPRATNPRF